MAFDVVLRNPGAGFAVALATTSAAVPTIGAYSSAGYSSANVATTPSQNTQATTGILVFAQWENGATPPVITDNKGNTFSAPIRVLSPNAGSLGNHLGAWFLSGVGGTGHVITATGTNQYPSVWLVEVVGADSTITHVGATASSSPFASGSLVTASDALLVGFSAYEGTGVTAATISPAEFTKLDEITSFSFWQGVTAHRNVSAGSWEMSAAVSSAADGGTILVAFYSSPPVVGGTDGYLTAWDGVANVRKVVKAWDNTAWIAKPVKVWDGFSWVLL